ncbi:MAG: hypothetical protein HXY52_08330 [Nitrospirae bacterium]|jgi:hypothetical protein|nr:hypothetical protein [Nitrospirota bacterium]
MKKLVLFACLGIPAVAGAMLGLIANKKHPVKGSLLGATTGVLAGSAVVAAYNLIETENKVPYYSKSSPLYEDISSF